MTTENTITPTGADIRGSARLRPPREDRRRYWFALLALCLGELMIVLDTTIVNVALPSIRADLGFSPTSLAWVMNSYMLTFGGFLLLAGRMGDVFSHRRMFLLGLVVFIAASLVCGVAGSPELLVGARAVQGLGGAAVSVISLSLIVMMFTTAAERAKAMGIIGFVIAAGGCLGVVLGGILTGALGWHWVFLVNVPLGAAVIVMCWVLVPARSGLLHARRLDVAGAVTVTTALLITVYAIMDGNDAGWNSVWTIGWLVVAAVLLGLFFRVEARAPHPLMPLALLRLRSVVAANLVSVLCAAALFAWFFLTALYLELVLGYTPVEVGLAFLPENLIMGVFSLGLSEKIVLRYGTRLPVTLGMLLVAASLVVLARAGVDGNFVADVLPSMLLLGVGMGIALNPILLAAVSEVGPAETGLASGVINTSFMMGGAVGLAGLTSLADARTRGLLAEGAGPQAALTGGYTPAFLLAAGLAMAAAGIAMALLRPPGSRAAAVSGAAPGRSGATSRRINRH
jgi:EmrB/QacA subfamily drug resistance transporter